MYYYRTSGSHSNWWRGEIEQSGYAASVTTLLWFKTLEGLTSHLESFILLCISEYARVCGWGLKVICGTTLVVFQCL